MAARGRRHRRRLDAHRCPHHAHARGSAQPPAQPIRHPNGAILPLTSSSDVFIPPRGRIVSEVQLRFPGNRGRIRGLSIRVSGVHRREHVLLSTVTPSRWARRPTDSSISCHRLRLRGRTAADARPADGARLQRATARSSAMSTPRWIGRSTRSRSILRGVPRGHLSAGGAPFFDPRDDEILLGYPFSGGDLFGPQGNGGLTTPLVLVQRADGSTVALSSLDDRVRTKRFYFQPGESGYRVECLVEAEGWQTQKTLRAPTWRIAMSTTVAAAAEAHYSHVAHRVQHPALGHAAGRARLAAAHLARRHAARHALHGLRVQRLRADARDPSVDCDADSGGARARVPRRMGRPVLLGLSAL